MIVHTVPVCLHMVTHPCGIMIAQGRTVVKGSETKSAKTYNGSGRKSLSTHDYAFGRKKGCDDLYDE